MSMDDVVDDGDDGGRLNHQHDAIGLYVMTEEEDFDN